MRILHVNDVASVGAILVRASGGRDGLFQPALRRFFPRGRPGDARFLAARALDPAHLRLAYRSGSYTHVHVHYGTFAYLAELAGLPYSLHVHGGEVTIHPFEGGLKHRLAQRGIARATRVAVSTPDLLAPILRLRPDAIYIPNPMEVPPAAPRRAARERPRLLMLSKMDPNKGWPAQVALMRSLVETLPGLSFSFLEKGDLPERERRRFAADLIALGGTILPWMERPVFLATLSEMDFAIGQLAIGSMGMSEMEAMASGVPTVANVREHVAIGHQPPVIAPDGAATEVARLWGATTERLAFAEAGRRYIAQMHEPAKALEQLQRLIG